MNSDTPLGHAFVGVDDGHYAIKIVKEDGSTFSIPSRIVQGKRLLSMSGSDDSADAAGAFYETDDRMTYTVSPHLETYNSTRTPDYPKSNDNRVLVHDALRRAGFGGQKVEIATGLPVNYYYIGEMINDRLIQAKKESLQKPVSSALPLAEIVRNVVTTEAIAAYFDLIMDIKGQPSADYKNIIGATTGIIDIGGRTTDCAVIYPGGTQVDVNRSGSSDIGILQLEARVKNYIRATFDLENVTPRLISQAIEQGHVTLMGQRHDVSEKTTQLKRELWADISNGLLSQIGSGKDLERLVVVGGGSQVLKTFIQEKYTHASFPENPAFANARGMLKIVKYVKKPNA